MQVEGVMALMIPILGLSIPIVAILTKHQRDMAQLLHGGGGVQQALADLQQQVNDLRMQLAATQAQLPSNTRSALPPDPPNNG